MTRTTPIKEIKVGSTTVASRRGTYVTVGNRTVELVSDDDAVELMKGLFEQFQIQAAAIKTYADLLRAFR